jgi:NAD+ synthase
MKGPSESEAVADWTVSPAVAERVCTDFVRASVTAARFERIVVGLSGGIDSAVSAALAVRALGPERVLGLLMPHRTSTADSVDDARAVADRLGIETELSEITAGVDALLADRTDADRTRRGNVMARVRMILLYDVSARDRRLVLGTGNRTESLLGYTTLYGDNACAFNAIGQLYKTEVRALGRHLELPPQLITKPPSAGLWTGQTDEGELGFTYAEIDPLLHRMIDERLEPRQLVALGHRRELVEQVRAHVARAAFKRRLPPVAEFPGRRDPDAPATAGAEPLAEGGIH